MSSLVMRMVTLAWATKSAKKLPPLFVVLSLMPNYMLSQSDEVIGEVVSVLLTPCLAKFKARVDQLDFVLFLLLEERDWLLLEFQKSVDLCWH